MAAQYYRPDLHEGLVLAFRHEESTEETTMVRWQGLDRNAVYELRNDDGGAVQRCTGQQLGAGYPLTIPHAHGSLLLHYRAVKAE